MPEAGTYSIRSAFAGKSLLLTGFTGFLGRALVEKILRDLPEVRRVWLLMRPRVRPDGSIIRAQSRLEEELRHHAVFASLREALGEKFIERCSSVVEAVSGDLALADLGLSAATRAEIVRDVDLVCACGAAVSFDEPLDRALRVNVESPLKLLELARDAHATFVHISTAYVNGTREGDIPEAISALGSWPLGAPKATGLEREISELQDLVRTATTEAELVERGMQRARARGWNDTYTYTKFLAEQLLSERHREVPTVIFRPSIIESSLREPTPGQLDGLRMADPLIVGFGKGRLFDFPTRRDVVLDLIPVDLVVNGILAAAARTLGRLGALEVFHLASSHENPLQMGELYDLVRSYFQGHPIRDRDGRPAPVPTWTFPTREVYDRTLDRWRRQLLWSRRAAGFFPARRRWRARLKASQFGLEQLRYYVDVYAPYANLRCRFLTERSQALREALCPAEQALFPFDARAFTWQHYIQNIHIKALSKFMDLGDRGQRADREAEPVLPASRLAGRVLQGSFTIALQSYLQTCVAVDVEGRQHVPRTTPCIFASNHCSHLDTAILRQALGGSSARVCVLGARDYFFDNRLKGWFFATMFDTLPIDRRAKSLEVLTLCREILARGWSLLIYPEGTRSRTGALQPFRPGVGLLSVELGFPVVPIHVRGTWEAMPHGKRWPRGGRIRVRLGAPVDLLDLARSKRRPYRAATERVRAAIEELGESS